MFITTKYNKILEYRKQLSELLEHKELSDIEVINMSKCLDYEIVKFYRDKEIKSKK